MQVFRAPSALARHRTGLKAMAAAGFDVELVETPEHIAQLEPALGEVAGGLAGAVLFRGQSSGDCRTFTAALAEQAHAAGVAFKPATRVQALLTESGRVQGVLTEAGEALLAGLTILCTGLDEAGLLRGLHYPPRVPVHGRTLTLGFSDPACAPSRSILDEDSRLFVARVGDTVRLAGFADLVGQATASRPGQTDALRQAFAALFPGNAAGALEVLRWTGFRPVIPDGVPMIGPVGTQGLWLNMGHGGFGWTMAAGSARLLADLIAGRDPAVPTADYAPHHSPSPGRP